MKKFEGILFCTDLDGTLLRDDKSVSRENLDAIEYFKREGGLFTFVTGRMPFFVTGLYETIKPNAPIGCINGGGVYDFSTNSYIWNQTLSRGALELVEYVDKNLPGIGIQVNTFNKIYFCRENSAMELFRSQTGVENKVRHYYDVEDPIAKIVFGDLSDERILKLESMLKSHPKAEEFDFIRSDEMLYEILPKGIAKGNAIKKLSEHFGIPQSRTVAVGDYNNDVDMINQAGVGIAVSNATEQAKSVADYVTVSNEEHAIAKIISDIENGNIRV